jgi:uncharacterized membrane protein
MSCTEKSLEINAPLGQVYKQWMQFEDFPTSLTEVRRLREISERHWHSLIEARNQDWEAAVLDEEPRRRIVWWSLNDGRNSGEVVFEPLAGDRTRLTVCLSEGDGNAFNRVGHALRLAAERVRDRIQHLWTPHVKPGAHAAG